MAENLVQDLFINSGYNVFNYGIERMMPGISKRFQINKDTSTVRALRYMPDFVIQSMQTGDLSLPRSEIQSKRLFRYKGNRRRLSI
jgi:hypothetical protein